MNRCTFIGTIIFRRVIKSFANILGQRNRIIKASFTFKINGFSEIFQLIKFTETVRSYKSFFIVDLVSGAACFMEGGL